MRSAIPSSNCTFRTVLHELCCIRIHPFPPPVANKCVEKAFSREMSSRRRRMVLSEDLFLQMLRDNNTSVMAALWVNVVQDIINQ